MPFIAGYHSCRHDKQKTANVTTIQIAADLAKLYSSFIDQKGLKSEQHRHEIKWLRCCLKTKKIFLPFFKNF